MPSEFDRAHAAVSELADDFATHESKYLSPAYKEAEVRKDFLDKFFIALGWDVNHDRQKNPYEQEVKVELGQQQGAARKRADYAFSLAPNFKQPRFFVEAKKPSRDLANRDDCFQTIRYGFSAQTPLAVLTDFEEFLILDSRYKAKPETAIDRIVNEGRFRYHDYPDTEKFARIYWLFSREAVADGSLEKFAADLPRPRGGAKQLALFPGGDKPFDEAFLEELDGHRLTLAQAFKKNDASLDGDTLTEITQRTLDRLVFIRFLEDRLIEPQDIISHLGARGSAWTDFRAACERLDLIYNGVVFKRHPLLDSPGFGPDEAAFADICESLCHKNSAYDFSTVPIHILGSIYERFLGNVITATSKQVRVEQKPEVRKAGGVYYTPDYIVRYIVENTVGKLIAGRSSDAVAKMRFADIACGSGSFLLGIYECLLSWHAAYYNQYPKQGTLADRVPHDDGTFHLTLKKRREILLNNIYGVDIDAQAVEVAQLSLYLRLLLEETESSTHQYLLDYEQQAIRQKILPSLADNIKCGNTLVGTDILHGQVTFTAEEERRLNPMDFEAAFPTIFPRFSVNMNKLDNELEDPSANNSTLNAQRSTLNARASGFDAIVGNPPYAILTHDNLSNSAVEYLNGYAVAEYKTDLFHLFIQRALDLLKKREAWLGYIIPSPWLTLKFTAKLRGYVLRNSLIEEIDVLEHKVFKDATVHTCLLLAKTGKPDPYHEVIVRRPNANATSAELIASATRHHVKQADWSANPLQEFETRLAGPIGKLVERLRSQFSPLAKIARASLGCQAYNSSKHTRDQIEKRVFHAESKLTDEYLPELAGKDVARYEIQRIRGSWIKYGPWLHDYRSMDWLEGPRILIREIPGPPPYSIQAAYTDVTYCHYKTILNVNPLPGSDLSMLYLTGILNSKLLSFLYPRISNKMVSQTFPRISVRDLRELPVPSTNLGDHHLKKTHDWIVCAVISMIEARTKLAAAKTERDADYYRGKCEALDREIDTLVYDLYGLTPEEIALVEG